MKTILVGTDFSKRSSQAVRRAVLLAKTAKAEITFLHVVDDDQPGMILDAERDIAYAYLEQESAKILRSDGVTCTNLVILGEPFAGLIDTARGLPADLLVIGPHRRQLLRDIFVGTTAERTIRATETPVLMVNGNSTDSYRHILIATDFSENAREALRTVLGMGICSKLSLLHVYDDIGAGFIAQAGLTDVEVVTRRQVLQQRELRKLREFHDLDPGLDIQFHVRPMTRPVADTILGVAEAISADLIVLGTRGRTGVARLLLGSVAQEVLGSASQDVLAVPLKH